MTRQRHETLPPPVCRKTPAERFRWCLENRPAVMVPAADDETTQFIPIVSE